MKTAPQNRFKCVFPAKSANESFARMIASAFVAQLDPRVDELADLKTAVSEAVTNVIVHAYAGTDIPNEERVVIMSGELREGRRIAVTVKDRGKGIEDVKKAREPLFTTSAAEERSGMGFTVMETFADTVKVASRPGKGTSVRLYKRFT